MSKQSIFVAVALIAVGLSAVVVSRPVGFSYAKFSGPVSGPEKAIYVKDVHGHHHIDYIAKPNYSFSYGVDDPKTKVLQNRKETRHGDAVKGEYSVVDPDGTLRVVKYTADKANGFQAEVITDGKSEMYGHEAQHPAQQNHLQQNHHQQHHEQDNHQHNPQNYYHQQEDGPLMSYGTNTKHPVEHEHYAGNDVEDDNGGEDDGEDGGSESSESGEDDEEY